MRIGIVAPSSRFSPEAAARVQRLAAERAPGLVLEFHPQCFLSHNHFAGTDAQRAEAFVEVANDPAFDAVWFARGGYGACRIAAEVIAGLGPTARDKTYLGYSDAGYLLAGLYRAGHERVVHGPMAADILRDGGEEAVGRALAWFASEDSEALEPGLKPGARHAAFNLTVLSLLLGTPLEPDLKGHVLLIEEVSEHMYRIDRHLFHLMSSPSAAGLAGLRLGRCSDVPANDPDFGESAEEVARFWCDKAGIPYCGTAEIGHDSGNRVVPFGPL